MRRTWRWNTGRSGLSRLSERSFCDLYRFEGDVRLSGCGEAHLSRGHAGRGFVECPDAPMLLSRTCSGVDKFLL